MATTKMFFRSEFGYVGFSDLENFWARKLPDDFYEVFQTAFMKSSRRLPGSLPTESSPLSPFHNKFERFDLGLIYRFFRCGPDFGRLMGSLLKYNVLEDFMYFQEVFQAT
ncbi:hypothetical protein F2Q70_00039585 [Brassica cretica]|uniref:Uncharacterized protein n=1 Tax=Brassica cretica TaxID=69181 RepID=A0A8S9K6E0_BRACR|nr:hypothetical protein F2Q70_00039585 [Brassica cretica]